MRTVDPKILHTLEEHARQPGRVLREVVDTWAEKAQVPRYGFAVQLFSFEGPECTYLSNADREDMIKMLEELTERLKTSTADELSRPKGSG
jgi:hypothetical protein